MIHVKLIFMAFMWAGGFIAARLIAHQAGPFTISFLRFFLASLVLAIGVRKENNETPMTLRLWGYALGAAFLGIFCYNYLFFKAMQFVEAGRGSVIMSTVPLVVALLSYVVYQEEISWTKMLGILCSFLGAGIVVSQGRLGSVVAGSLGPGECMLLGGVLCAAAFTMFSKSLLQSLAPVRTMVVVNVLGTAFLVGPALREMARQPVDVMAFSFLINLMYLAVGPSVVAVLIFYEGIRVVGPARASQYMNLMPFFAVILGIVFLGEQLTVPLLAGGGLVTAGLCLTNFNFKKGGVYGNEYFQYHSRH